MGRAVRAVPLHLAVLRRVRRSSGLFPLVFTAWVSVHEWGLLSGKGEYVGLQNYREVWENPYFLKQTVNTLSIFVLSSGPQIVIAVVLAALLDTSTCAAGPSGG